MTMVDIHGMREGLNASGLTKRPRLAEPAIPELLLQVGVSLQATLIVDSHGQVVWMDEALAAASGWKDGESEEKAAEEVLDSLPWLLTALRTAFTGKEAVAEGESRGQPARAVVLPVFGNGGQLVGACARLSLLESMRPGPAAPHEEQSLLELSRTHLHHSELVDNIDGIVWEADANFRFTFVSQQAERLLGYPIQQWMQEPDFWRKHVHPEDRDWACSFCVKATHECRPHEFEYRMVAADGRTVWLRDIVTVKSENGTPLKLQGIMVDVTEQSQARERLEHTVSLLRATLDSTADGLLVTDREQRITAFNQKFQDLWRVPDLPLNMRDGRQVLEALIPQVEHPEQYAARVQELYASPEAESFDTVELRDGHVLERYSRPQRLGDTIIGRVWSFRDVTAERRARAERERSLHEAHEAIRVRDDFLSIASHELKTPLTPLKLHLQMLKQRSATGQPLPPQLAERALAQVGRLSALINDLLDASRVEAGRLEMQRVPVRLREVVREVLAQPRPVNPHHTLEYEECAEDVLVQGDASRLEQVLTNLLENALKYSPTGGKIRVAVTHTGKEARVSVSDSGIGIPADQQAHLFERFFRARNAPISGFGGLGLGLYICRDIIERHGGRIWVESEVGRGSTFRFTLPLMAGEA
ncbi:PAS domain-containing sensor histidine kinase [Archangium lipolyticum]|uniref:PAS domain-containing sensor histidine kinase n=1 Tax=Archangium lipolyticum TaxID=2970465 RepID=UPI00214A5AF9|nr:ATP-binding protein [Archangium lipolyticum]